MRYVTAIFLYILFSITSMAAGVVGALSLFTFKTRRISAIMHSMDMLLAAILGWDGRSTVSKECGRELEGGSPSRFCRCLCYALDKTIEEGHCKKEAKL